MRFLAAHEIDIAHMYAGVTRKWGGPDKTGGPVTQQVHDGDRGDIVGSRQNAEALRLAPTVTRLITPECDGVAPQIKYICGAGAVDITEADAALVELIRVVEEWRVIHRHFPTKPAVAEVRPVAHF